MRTYFVTYYDEVKRRKIAVSQFVTKRDNAKHRALRSLHSHASTFKVTIGESDFIRAEVIK